VNVFVEVRADGRLAGNAESGTSLLPMMRLAY